MPAFILLILPVSVLLGGAVTATAIGAKLVRCGGGNSVGPSRLGHVAVRSRLSLSLIRRTVVRLIPLLVGGILGVHLFETSLSQSAIDPSRLVDLKWTSGPAEKSLIDVRSRWDLMWDELLIASGKLICRDCHQFEPGPAQGAPNLFDVGMRLTREKIVAAVLAPSMSVARGFERQRLVVATGEVLEGVVETEDEREVAIRMTNGDRTLLPSSQVETRIALDSPMSDGLTADLTATEFWQLINYIGSLKGDDGTDTSAVPCDPAG